MPSLFDPRPDLTPEGIEVLKDIERETQRLRELDLGDTPPAAVYEAG